MRTAAGGDSPDDSQVYAEPAGRPALFAAVAASKDPAWQTITDRLGRRRGFADGGPRLAADRNVVASERLWDRLRIASAITQGTDGRRFTTNIERCVPRGTCCTT